MTLIHWNLSLRSGARKPKIQGQVTKGGSPPLENDYGRRHWTASERIFYCINLARKRRGVPGSFSFPNDDFTSSPFGKFKPFTGIVLSCSSFM